MQPIKIYTQPEIEVTIGNDQTVVEVNQAGTPIELTVGGTFVLWGDIVGNITDQTDLQNALNGKVDENSPITGATKTKITYDSKGLVTAGADATVSDISGLQTALDLKVPYTGATGNVTLGEYGLTTGYVQFDTTPTTFTPAIGNMGWNDSEGTIDLLLRGGIVSLPLGQKQVARVVNGTGGNVLKSNYQVVKVTGAQGQRLQVNLAQANNDANSADTLGLIAENINNNNAGFIITLGLVENINTTGSLQSETWVDGNVLYLSPTTAGAITNVKPQAPQHTVIVGFVVYAHQNNGKIFVKVDNGYEIDELHNVRINTGTLANGQVLKYNTSLSVWENGAASGVGTVTSITATSPLTGGTITSSGSIGIPQATGSVDGYLSSTDWTTFNSKQNALTNPLTGTGVSGQVSYWNGTTTQTGSNNLFWDDANGRLGVGTNAPSFALQVQSDAQVNGVRIGLGAGSVTTNTILGSSALNVNTTGFRNVAIGQNALLNNSTGTTNVAIGRNALSGNTDQSNNTAIGNDALSLGNASANTAIGSAALNKTTGSNNVGVGSSVLTENTTGERNSAIGQNSLGGNVGGSQNTAIGRISGRYIADGLTSLTTANNSTFLGYDTRANANSQTNQLVIGYQAIGLGSNTTVIGNTSTTFGRFYGNLLIGSNVNGGQALQVTGDTLLKGSGNTSATTALTVQNSDGTPYFRVTNNGAISFGGSLSTLSIFPQQNNALTLTNDVGFRFNSSLFQTQTGFDFYYNNGQGARTITSGVGGFVSISPQSFSPTSGTATFTTLQVTQTINQTGGANGITRGLYVNPTLTAAANWRSIETSNNTGYSLYLGGSADAFLNDGTDIQLGTTTGTKIGTATSQKLSFWNATPIVQPTTGVAAATRVGGGGTTLTDSDTFDGYTLAQIVKALRNTGILA